MASSEASSRSVWNTLPVVLVVLAAALGLEIVRVRYIDTRWDKMFASSLFGYEWGRCVFWAAGVALVAIAGRRSLLLVLAAAIACTLASFGTTFAILATLVAVGTWGVSKLGLPRWARLLLVVLVVCGPMLAGYHASFPGLGSLPVLQATMLGGLAMRALLYQAECSTLVGHRRGLIAYGGILALSPAAGAPFAPPVSFKAMLDVRERRPWARVAAGGVVLFAIAIVYFEIAGELQTKVFPGMIGAAKTGRLEAYLIERGQLRLLGDMVVPMLVAYFTGAAIVFMFTSHLRLLGMDVGSGYMRPFLSSDFPDFWRRWDYFYREAALKLFFYPTLGRVRKLASAATVTAMAVVAAFIGLIVFRRIVEPVAGYGQSAFSLPHLYPLITRMAVVGAFTVVTAYVAVRWPRPSPPSLAVRGVHIALTMGTVCLLFAATVMLMFRMPISQIAQVTGAALLGP